MAIVISEIRHPQYKERINLWTKWRRVYEGGEIFRDAYLEQYSVRETEDDFDRRKRITPIPRFSGAAVDEVKNSIFQRMSDIGREGGGRTYTESVKGINGGVDKDGCSMNMFVGQYVLPELLVLSKVGVFVDMPEYSGETLAQTQNLKPYLYTYCVEDIFSWSLYGSGDQTYFKTLLLRDTLMSYDDETGLTTGYIERFRRLWLDRDGFVNVQFYDWAKEPGATAAVPKSTPKLIASDPIRLNLTKIPFVCFELNKSLIADIADYQIALLNLESADINYSLRSNFPFYTEEYDVRENPPHLKDAGATIGSTGTTNAPPIGGTKEIKVGTVNGRRRPKGLAEPSFINPSSEPLMASMKKQDAIKADIRRLLGLSLSAVQAVHASADSKEQDKGGLESGLSYIGLELENGERRISEIWAEYMSDKPATVNYPRKYALKTEAERREEAKQQKELQGAAPSITYQKEIAKQIAETMLGGKVSEATLNKAKTEIDTADYITSDPDAITLDIENGLVTAVTASTARGYDGPKEVPKALEEQAKKLAIIATSQSQGIGQARGVPTPGVDPKASKQEKKGKPQRGPAK